jgi:hypothetical protein
MNNEISKLWEIIATGPDSVHELRAFHYQDKSNVYRQVFKAAEYESVDAMKKAFEAKALELNARGYNIYITLNPIRQDFGGESAKDTDIAFRDLLLIDIDRTGDTKKPATDQDIQNAKDLADEVMSYLSGLGWPKPMRVMSGNGHHLYYILDELVNNDESTVIVKSALKGLATKFNNENVSIDTSVSNASRITKAVGTRMRKSGESEGRPHRIAVLCE